MVQLEMFGAGDRPGLLGLGAAWPDDAVLGWSADAERFEEIDELVASPWTA